MKLLKKIMIFFLRLLGVIRLPVNPVEDDGNPQPNDTAGGGKKLPKSVEGDGNPQPNDTRNNGLLKNDRTGDNRNPQPNTSVSIVSKTYTGKTCPFLTSELNLDYKTTYNVSYSISDSVNAKFPIIRAPKKGCEIKLPVCGRSGKRGVCEEILCKKIKELELHGFYDNLSLLVGKNTYPKEPDLAYINAQKGIFIDIEIDEPYSGWEREPIHYKIKNGTTVDDARNDSFTERGWTVIRFSERQVYEHPKSCLKRVYQLLREMDTTITMPGCLATEPDISPDDIWTKEQAKRMEENSEREKMLGIDKFIQPVEEPHTNIKDYLHGQEIEKKISNKKEEQWKGSEQILSRFIINSPQHPKVSTSNSDNQKRREAEQYEHQHISTLSTPKTTPSSRGYA